ncbi:MAG: hypothetical protein HYT97_09900 [Elusimicrobia bacterium]|nr:hypothetical protein [Elusimicrobiota bacterium]
MLGNVSSSYAFVAGQYRCLKHYYKATELTSDTFVRFESGKDKEGSAVLKVFFEDTLVCRIEPPFLIHIDGSYSKSSEQGTFKINGGFITFSESKIRGPGKIDETNNQIVFNYLYGGNEHVHKYYLIAGTEEGTVTGTGTGTGSKTLKAEVKVDYSVVRADGTVRADGGFDPEKGDVATFTFTPNDSEKVSIKIFSRHSEQLDSGELDVTAGTAAAFTWDGRTKDSKNPVASGVYIVRIEGSGVQETRKIVVVK